MDVSISDLRAHLSDWLSRVQEGEEVVVTERGTPVARIVSVSGSTVLDELERNGLIGRPQSSTRPRATERRRVRAKRSVAGLVSSQRD